MIGVAVAIAAVMVRAGGKRSTEAAAPAAPAAPAPLADTAPPDVRAPAPVRDERSGDGLPPTPIVGRRDALTGPLLEGIVLSADQEERLEQMRTRQRQQEQYDRQRYGESAREAQSRNQSMEELAREAARLREMQAEMGRRQEGYAYEIRGILTYEQTPRFDKNLATWKALRGHSEGR